MHPQIRRFRHRENFVLSPCQKPMLMMKLWQMHCETSSATLDARQAMWIRQYHFCKSLERLEYLVVALRCARAKVKDRLRYTSCSLRFCHRAKEVAWRSVAYT